MKTVDIAQGSPEWFEWRKGGITGTDMPAILGASPYMTPWRVWAEKIGVLAPADLSRNPNVIRGKRCEPEMRRIAEKMVGDILLPYCLEDEEDPTFLFSSDGVSSDGTVVEMKNHSEAVFQEIKEQGLKHPAVKAYGTQLQYGMSVARAKRGVLLMFRSDEDGHVVEYLTLWRTAKPEIWQEMRQKGRAFHNLVLSQTPPALDPERDTVYPQNEEQQQVWAEIARRYIDAQAKLERLEGLVAARTARLKSVEAEIDALLGPHKSISCPVGDLEVMHSRFAKKGFVDWSSLVTDHLGVIDQAVLDSYRKPGQSGVKTTIRNSSFSLPLHKSSAA